MNKIIELKNISKEYDGETVLDVTSYTVKTGKLAKEKEEAAKLEAKKAAKKQAEEKLQMDIISAKKRKDNLSVKISDWKKKGKDTSELRKEWEMLRDFLKNNK